MAAPWPIVCKEKAPCSRRRCDDWRATCWQACKRRTAEASSTGTSSRPTSCSTEWATPSSAISARLTCWISARRKPAVSSAPSHTFRLNKSAAAASVPRRDQYALAATLFEALTGRAPFLGPDLVAQHLSSPLPSLSLFRPGLAPALDETLARAMQKAPTDRFPSAHDMALAISAWPDAPVPAPLRATASPAPPEDATPSLTVLGRSHRGRMLLVHEPRVDPRGSVRRAGRPLLTSEEIEGIRALAALGGPQVQRILALTDDLRTITYEVLPGQPIRLEALSPEQRTLLDPVWLPLTLLGFPPDPGQSIVLTPAGPVVVVAPPYQAAKS